MAKRSGAFVHYEIRRADGVIVVDNEFVVVQNSTHFRENLISD
jgi:hypothetical protein